MKSLSSSLLAFQRGKWFHNLIVVLDRMDRVPALAWYAAAVLALAAASLSWPGRREFGMLVGLTAVSLEGLAILSGRASRLSPAPFGGQFAIYASTHVLATWALGFAPLPFPAILAIHLTIQFGLLAAMLWGSMVEPYRIGLRTEEVAVEDQGPPIKILLVSDLHLDRYAFRERRALELARAFAPDLILCPGDFTNLTYIGDAAARGELERFFSELRAVAPVFASRGTPEVDSRWWIDSFLPGAGAVILDNESVRVKVQGRTLRLLGVTFDDDHAGNAKVLHRLTAETDSSPTILLHHSPDLAPAAAKLGVSLYVAGHTHGGQVRFPLVGALYAASKYGVRYAQGAHRLGAMTLVVSRGIGLEGAGAPRLRVLSPPEVVGITLRAKA
jgi:hypothetical protein